MFNSNEMNAYTTKYRDKHLLLRSRAKIKAMRSRLVTRGSPVCLHSTSGKIWVRKANEKHTPPSSTAEVSLNQEQPPSCSGGAAQWPNRSKE